MIAVQCLFKSRTYLGTCCCAYKSLVNAKSSSTAVMGARLNTCLVNKLDKLSKLEKSFLANAERTVLNKLLLAITEIILV